MYLHLGQNRTVRSPAVIGIFDLDTCTHSHHSRAFLSRQEQTGAAISVSQDLPRSFIVCDGAVYISPISSATLGKRAEDERYLAE